MEENHFATKALVDVCKYYGVSRFVFASSCSVYGAGKSLLNEESTLNPVSLYAQSKLYAERELLREASNDFHPIIMRFGTLYGYSPRMRFDLVANTMTAHAFSNKKITVDGGAQWRPLLHVDDAAAACVAALTAPIKKVSSQIFNVGDTDENYTIDEIAHMVKKYIPGTTIVSLDTVKDRRDYKVSFKKINTAMKWKATHTLSEGIKEVVTLFKKKKFKDWKDKRYSNYLTLKSVFDEAMQ
jgi:nucleoside-diphosphate-sugar epimerase